MSEFLTNVLPIMLPLVAAYFEQRKTRQEVQSLRQALANLEVNHAVSIASLDVRLTALEKAVAGH